MYLPSLHALVSQGDLFDPLTYRYVYEAPETAEPEIRSRRIRGILLSADCEYDKASLVYVGEVRPMEEIDRGTRGNVRTFRVRALFPLEALGETLAESYVDLRRIYRFDKQKIEAGAQHGLRVASLNETAQLALQEHLSVFFGFERRQRHEENRG